MLDQSSSPAGPGSPVFDRAHLARYTSGDAALEAELIGLFEDQAERCVALMESAPDRAAWRAAAHTLKGAARGVGAFALGDICEEAEELPEPVWPGARLRIVEGVRAARAEMGRAG